jgi:ankyrin repeat protein
MTALHLAVRSGADGVGDDVTAAALVTDLRRVISRKGDTADEYLNAIDARGMTPLHYAALFNAPLAAQALLLKTAGSSTVRCVFVADF